MKEADGSADALWTTTARWDEVMWKSWARLRFQPLFERHLDVKWGNKLQFKPQYKPYNQYSQKTSYLHPERTFIRVPHQAIVWTLGVDFHASSTSSSAVELWKMLNPNHHQPNGFVCLIKSSLVEWMCVLVNACELMCDVGGWSLNSPVWVSISEWGNLDLHCSSKKI